VKDDANSGKSKRAKSFTCPFCGKPHRIYMIKCPDYGQVIDDVFKLEGRVLDGKYEVGSLIAEGGMGVVYEGRHLTLGQKLAIKFLMRDMVKSPALLARFQNEARMAASLGHRNIVEVIDMGSTNEKIPFIVMEFLEGHDLANVLMTRTRLPIPLAVDFTIQILGALRAVHQKGIIHRDLKPENVFIVEEAGGEFTIKIVDFGVSRLGKVGARKGMRLTQTGSVFGTPRYMAPEQARGDREIDHRVDLYACGVLLYEMLTGAVPFDREEYNTLIIAITTEDPVHVSSHGIKIPAGLDDVVMKALVKDPDERFADVEEFMQALAPYRSDQLGSMEISVSIPSPPGEDPADGPSPSSIQEAVTITPGSRRERDPGDPATGPSSTSSTSRSRDTDRTAPGWEGMSGARAKPHRSRALWTVLAVCLVVVAAGGGAVAAFFMKERAARSEQPAEERASEEKPPEETPVVTPPAWFTLDLEGLPEGAEVYVDDLLHPERPIMVARSDRPSALRIAAPGYEDWERQMDIAADIAMPVEMTPLPPPAVEPARQAKKKKKKKKKNPVPKGSGKKIDRTFPGLK
jgi:serine/threonine-protein kinase